MVLYTINAAMVLLIAIVFPFVILDLYFKGTGSRGYWAWLLAVIIHMIRWSAGARIGIFKAISLDDAYAVGLLTLVAIVFYLLCRKSLSFLPTAPHHGRPRLSGRCFRGVWSYRA